MTNRWIEIIFLSSLCAAGAQAQQAALSPAEIRMIAEKAYTFAYPLVLMELTRRNSMEHATLGRQRLRQSIHARC